MWASPLTITGQPFATVFLSCETPGAVDTDVIVRLTEVYPDGRSMLLVDNGRRASLRAGYSAKSLLSPGQIVPVQVELPPISVTIRSGHRLRVLVGPSSDDRFDVNPQDGSPLSDVPGVNPTVSTVRIWSDANHPSRISLPVAMNAPVASDLNRDGHVDELDVDLMRGCRTGPGVPYIAGSPPAACLLQERC